MSELYPHKVLVAGATGGVGKLVVRRLRLLNVPARILTRDRQRAARLGDVDVVEGDALVRGDCARAVADCDAIVCTLGDRTVPQGRPIVDGDGIVNLIDAAAAAGSQRFVLVSSLGVGDSWHWLPFFIKWFFRWFKAIPILNEKARSEEYLKGSALQWTILRPGGLFNWRMRAEPLLTVAGRVAGITTRQATADVAVRSLASQNALRTTLTVVNHSVRATLEGTVFQLDVPWQPW
ncbi:MAG TPA: SDR family oxidoreductase [Gemmataceae bacterium]|nr:SDR family oxidoreductase [Gemmataceae bacterium]